MNWSPRYTLVLVALLLGGGAWLASRLVAHRRHVVFQSAPTRNDAAVPASAPGSGSEATNNCIDLSPHFNDSLDNGWQHRLSPGNNLGPLPRGRQVFGGVEFDVRGIIQLTSSKLRQFAVAKSFPERVRGIRVGRNCRQLHFLHATGWNAPPGTWVGSYIVHYTDGTLDDAPILYGDVTGNWWALPEDLKRPGAGVVWQGTNAAKQPVQLFKQSWDNPRPDLEIKSLDFESRQTRVAPFLIAVTAE